MLLIPLETSLYANFDWIIKTVDVDAQVVIIACENVIHWMSLAIWNIQLSSCHDSFIRRVYEEVQQVIHIIRDFRMGLVKLDCQLENFVQKMSLRTLLETIPETREGIRMGHRKDGLSWFRTSVLNQPYGKLWHWNGSLSCFWIREGWQILVLPYNPVPCNEVTSDETAWLR